MQTYDQGQNKRPVKCIGCHTSTPDGLYISYNDFYPWAVALASGTSPAGMAPPAASRRGRPQCDHAPWVSITTFSPTHWASGDRIMVAARHLQRQQPPLQPCNRQRRDMDQQPGLAWFDLESAAAPSTTRRRAGPARHGLNWIYEPVAAPSRRRVVEPRRHQGAVHDDGQGEVGRSAPARTRTLYGPVFETGPQAATPVPGDGSAAGKAQGRAVRRRPEATTAGRDRRGTTHRWIRWTRRRSTGCTRSRDRDPSCGRRRPEAQARRELAAPVSGSASQPRINNSELVAPGRDVGESHLLLADLLVVAGRRKYPRADRSRFT